ncbi:MAG: FHA domain-containing protein [Solobacterium sp.]|nr:FHA domain-containing protein [Solobacterium sp.]
MKSDTLVKTICAAALLMICAAVPNILLTVHAGSLVLNAPAESPAPTDYSALKAAIYEAEAMDLSQYDEEAVKSFVFVLDAAKQVVSNESATQDMVDSAVKSLENAKKELQGNKSMPKSVIFIAAGVCLLAAAGAAFVILRKKNEAKTTASEQPAYNERPSVPVQPSGYREISPAAKPSRTESSAETTLLENGSAPETTLLAPASYGTLVNTKTEEKVNVNKDHFRIGREKTNVDYCVENNTNVGRYHAEIFSEDQHTYVIDRHSRNGTFLNGVRIESEEPVEIIDGDKIKFADEEYTFLQ